MFALPNAIDFINFSEKKRHEQEQKWLELLLISDRLSVKMAQKFENKVLDYI